MGSSGGQQSTNEFKPPEWTQQGWRDYTQQAQNMAQTPYQQYFGMRTAPLNDVQDTGLKFTMDRALYGAPDLNAARQQATQSAGGMYLGMGPGASAAVTPDQNPYMGANPYLQSVIGNTANDMARAHATGTAAQNDSMFARGGAYGGSAWQQKQSADAAGLADRVGNMAQQGYMQDYTSQQGLAENAINRGLQAQQYNLGMRDSSYQSERDRMLQASGLGGQLSQDDWQAGRALTGAGDAYNAYTQRLLDDQLGEFNRQQMYPYQQMQFLGDALSQASGSYGTRVGTQNNGGMSTAGHALALGGLLYGMS